MRLIPLFLVMAFALQTMDAPPLREHANPKTCCGRKICLCKHQRGAPCDYKAHRTALRADAAAVQSQQGDCPFHPGMKRSAMTALAGPEVLDLIEKISNAAVTLRQAPCRSNTPKSLLPDSVRDYELPVSFHLKQTVLRYYKNKLDFKSYLSPDLSGPDHPPKGLSLI